MLEKLKGKEPKSNSNKLGINTKEETNQVEYVGSMPWAQSEYPKSSKTLFTSKCSSPTHLQIKNGLF